MTLRPRLLRLQALLGSFIYPATPGCYQLTLTTTEGVTHSFTFHLANPRGIRRTLPAHCLACGVGLPYRCRLRITQLTCDYHPALPSDPFSGPTYMSHSRQFDTLRPFDSHHQNPFT